MKDCKSCATPVNYVISLTNESESFRNPSLYQTIIGSLYIRLDIAFGANRLSQFLFAPNQ